MIASIEYPTETLEAGAPYTIKTVAAEPIAVQIKCFVGKPPPPGFRPCAECGSFRIRSGEVLHLIASERAFQEAGGVLEVTVLDAEGDSRLLNLRVAGREEEHGTPAVGVEYA